MASVITLPSNVEAEKTVLGSILISASAAEVALSSLDENDFAEAEPRNRILFHAMKTVKENGNPVDPQTVYDALVNLHMDSMVSNDYILSLVDTFIVPENVDHYIEMVREQSVLRQFLLKMKEIQDNYAKGVSDIGNFIASSNDSITEIAQKRSVQGMRSAREIAAGVNSEIAKKSASDNRTGLLGVETGYKKLNQMTHGWHNGDLIILAARPSVGKTAFGMNLAYNAAFKQHIPVAFFSLEMSADRVMERLIASRACVSNDHIQTGFLSASERVKVSNAIDEISKQQLYFDDTPNSRLGDIISKANKLKAQHPNLGLIVIDYLGRITYSDHPSPNARQQEVSNISGGLKTLARQLDVPIICLAQLNRNVEDTESKVPQLSHLRESGSIEQDADIVMLMYRADYYADLGQKAKGRKSWGSDDKDKKEEQPQQQDFAKTLGEDVSSVKILVAKNRNGEVGKLDLIFSKSFSRFDDPSPAYEEKLSQFEANQFGD